MTKPSNYGDADYETVDLTPQDLEPNVQYSVNSRNAEYERIMGRTAPMAQTSAAPDARVQAQPTRAITDVRYSGTQGRH